MFKVVMIIYVVAFGYEGARWDRVGDIDVIMMENLAQCEFAKIKIEEVTEPWGSGKDEDRTPLQIKKSVECFELPEDALSQPFEIKVVEGKPQITIKEQPERLHKRWNEQ